MNIKNGALLLFIILIASLLLCSILGGNYKEGYTDKNTLKNDINPIETDSNTSKFVNDYDNYDHYSGSSSPTKYYGPNGGDATITPDENNSHMITVTNSNGKTTQYSLTNDTISQPINTTSNSMSSIIPKLTNKTFYGPNGGSARIFIGKDGQYAIEETQPNGNTTIYTASNTYTYNYDNSNSNSSISSGSIIGPSGNSAGYITGPNGNTVVGTNTSTNDNNSQFYSGSVTGPAGNSAGYITGPNGNTITGTSINNTGQYNSSLPSGIPGRMIPPGQEDLYILKSEVVPPVCPVCPTSSACPRTEKCPPCPACARCPEPSFECKKVPNYNNINENYLPVPVLSSFSAFGM